jgi:folate-binding protein YgfZ
VSDAVSTTPDPEQADEAAARALREGVALVALAAADHLDLAGVDRVRFLHNLTTCDVRSLASGASVRGFLTDVKGHVLSDVDVVALEERFRLRLPPGRGGPIAGHLARYVIADRVEITPRSDLAAAELRGARAPALLEALGAAPPEAGGAHHAIELGGVAVRVRARRPARWPRLELSASAVELPAALAALRAAGAGGALVEAGPGALEAVRVEDGELLWGVDYGAGNFPQETGEEAAVSTTKGCYLGQEVVARLHFRGQLQRLARGLVFDAGARPEPGAELVAGDGRPAARVTSVARSYALGRWVGLALVHRRAAEPGTRLALPDGALAEVRVLPLV